ncbi:MAG: mandelate racemase/muconate lactonizing enzyme family protein [Dongiaceae bacterium]
MKIVAVRMYQLTMPISGAGYAMSRGRLTTSLDSTIVELVTDQGLSGWGESCPFGSNYLPGLAGAARAVISELAPHVVGQDPRATDVVNDIMDRKVMGHGFAKSAIDIACWDLIGKSNGVPLYLALGGLRNPKPIVRTGVTLAEGDDLAATVAARRAKGFRVFSLKLGDDPYADIEQIRDAVKSLEVGELLVADANGGWRLDQALHVAHATAEFPQVMFEQPCASLADCVHLARRVPQTVVFDECVEDLPTLSQVVGVKDATAFNLKIERVGGITKARQMRDYCLSMGCALFIQEVGGAEITQAATVHLAHATPGEFLLGTSYPKVNIVTADGAPELIEGRTVAGTGPGLGIAPRLQVLQSPVHVCS